MEASQKITLFSNELSRIVNDNMRQFAEVCIAEIPDYFFDVPASSSGKYHPKYAVLDHGLLYHVKAACIMLEHFLWLDHISKQFSDREKDMMRIALILHDSRKSGRTDEEKSEHTLFKHPLIAAEEIEKHKNDGIIRPNEVFQIARMVSSHMGQWTTSKYEDGELPRPYTNAEELVHMSDYLASRKGIIIEQPEYYLTLVDDDMEVRIPYGVHMGKKYEEVKEKHPDHLLYMLKSGFCQGKLRELITRDKEELEAML